MVSRVDELVNKLYNLETAQEPSSPYIPFNRENNPSAYPSSGEGQKGLPPEPPGEIEPKQLELPIELAGLSDDLKINAAEHKGAQKQTKIYNKATQGAGSETEWLKKTGPQLPRV